MSSSPTSAPNSSPSAPPPRRRGSPLKQFLGCVAALIALPLIFLVILALVLPNRWESEQRITIPAPRAEVHAFLDDATNWEQWFKPGPGYHDIPITYTVGGPGRGAGSTIAWSSEVESIGSGTVTITASRVEAIDYTVSMAEERVTAEGTIALDAVDAGTLITWRDSGTIPRFPGGLMAWLVERGVDQIHAENLLELKRIFARRARE